MVLGYIDLTLSVRCLIFRCHDDGHHMMGKGTKKRFWGLALCTIKKKVFTENI